MTPKKFAVVVMISGRGSNLGAILRYCKEVESSFEVVGVVSDKATAPGLLLAKEHAIKCSIVSRRKQEITAEQFEEELIRAVADYKPDLIALAGFMRILPPRFIRTFPDRILNIHPSLLPSFRGLNAQKQALEARVKFAGCTVHYVIDELDAGPIIAQAVVPVFNSDDEEKLSNRILLCEHNLYPKVIQNLAQNNLALDSHKHHFLEGDKLVSSTHPSPMCLTSV